MSAFIVISVKDSLNWIVDGISLCRPHNPSVVTYLSTGKIKKEDENKYHYEYTVFSKHVGDNCSDSTLAKTNEIDIPRNLFSNQIAQFLHVSENAGEQLNVFLLDNPMTETDFEQSSWLINEIRAVYESRKVTNFQLVRVLFSYQIDRPTDVNMQVSQMILKELTRINFDETDDFPTKILYIDNQNRSGAVLCLNKEEHDLMIPRMLCDFMMLLSNANDSYSVSAAINGQTQLFALGYSECMYYHDDVFKYYRLAGERDLLQFILEEKNLETSLDYNKFPTGLRDRVERLNGKYVEVPFTDDILDYSASIDKEIDDIVTSFKKEIISVRDIALKEAKQEDDKATYEKVLKVLISCGLIAAGGVDPGSLLDLIEIAKVAGVELDGLIVHDAVDRVNNDYPEYIDRTIIYKEHIVEDAEGDCYVGRTLEENVRLYSKLIEFIQKGVFKKYLMDTFKGEKEVNSNETPLDNDDAKPKKKKCFFARLFGCGRKSSLITEQVIEAFSENEQIGWQTLFKKISSIKDMKEERVQYYQLIDKVSELEERLAAKNNELKQFRLTEHCSSVDCLIDLDALIKYHGQGKDERHKKILANWGSRKEHEKTIEGLLEELKEQTKWDLYSFYYINWDEPFAFIKNIDLVSVCESLKRKSQPFVNTFTLGPKAENLTTRYYYTDNTKWHDSISTKQVDISEDSSLGSVLSSHICSKLCMFQFLQMSRELIEGLVDCIEDEG